MNCLRKRRSPRSPGALRREGRARLFGGVDGATYRVTATATDVLAGNLSDRILAVLFILPWAVHCAFNAALVAA